MITVNDIKKLKKVFVTKQELKDELRYQKEDILDHMDRTFAKRFKEFRDEMLKAIAEMLHVGVDPMLDDHETRIKKLEKRVFATT